LHRLAEERSLALHAAIAARIETDPSLIARARDRVDAWLRGSGDAPHSHYSEAWSRILSSTCAEIRRHLIDPSERGRALRQVTPFAGAIAPRERWKIWREVRAGVQG
jgi:hypothetical protein